MDLSKSPPCGPSSSNLKEDKEKSGNCSPNRTQLVRTTMVPRVNSNCCGLASDATPASISAVPSISACSASPPLAVTSSSSLALIRNCYQATGFLKKVSGIFLVSRVVATQRWYTGPWKAWFCWCSQRTTCPLLAPVAEVPAFLTSLVTQGNLEYRTTVIYNSAIFQTHDPIGSTESGSLPTVSRLMKGVFKSTFLHRMLKQCCHSSSLSNHLRI